MGNAARSTNLFRRVLSLLLKCALAFVLLSFALVLTFRFAAPPFSALMIERRLGLGRGAEPYSAHYDWVPFDRIAPVMALAVIASEDQNFSHHHGFDWRAIQKAAYNNERGDRVHGASTLTQQAAKNLFLWPGRDWFRKGAEAYMTVLLETCWTKRRILETYLNIVELGDGIFGVESASQRYFHKPAVRLSADEAALLAAVLPDPHRLKVSTPSAYVRERQQWILRQMNQIGGTSLVRAVP
jgi:monofunctional biosynthetic peptidoglycan transglycosylase